MLSEYNRNAWQRDFLNQLRQALRDHPIETQSRRYIGRWRPVPPGHWRRPVVFRIDKTDDLMQIDLVVYGQKYPSIVIPPTQPVRSVQFLKRYGSFSPPRNGVGNVCSDHAYLVAELGSAAGPDTKTCRMCVMRSQYGLLLKDTAVLEGQLIDAASKNTGSDSIRSRNVRDIHGDRPWQKRPSYRQRRPILRV
jgi:hypothetical protein